MTTMIYTITVPGQEGIFTGTADSLLEAVQRKAAWFVNQNQTAIILDPDGYIVSNLEQQRVIAGYA